LRAGGAERVASRLTQYISKERKVITITWDGSNPGYCFGGEIIDLRLPAESNLFRKVIQQQRRIIKLREILIKYEVRQAIGIMESANVPLVLTRSQLKMPIHISVTIHTTPDAFHGIMKWNMKRVYPRADRIVLLTKAGMTAHVREWGFPADRCCVIPNPLDDTFLGTYPPLFQSRTPGLIVAVGRLTEIKGFGNLIEAFSKLINKDKYRMIILGEGPLRPQLEKQIERLELASLVTLHGFTNDTIPWLDKASLYVLSSLNEGFPMALAEAMARGCPIVSTDCSTGPGEMLRHEMNGLLVPVGNIDLLSQSMNRLLEDRVLAEKCGNEARNHSEQWAIERIIPEWLI